MNANDGFASKFISILISRSILVLIGTIITFVYYILSSRQMRRVQLISPEQNKLRRENLFLYPIVLFIIFLPPDMSSILSLLITIEEQGVFFLAVKTLLTHSLGLANAIVYGFQRRKLYKAYKKEQFAEFEPESSESLNWDSIKEILNNYFFFSLKMQLIKEIAYCIMIPSICI